MHIGCICFGSLWLNNFAEIVNMYFFFCSVKKKKMVLTYIKKKKKYNFKMQVGKLHFYNICIDETRNTCFILTVSERIFLR